MSTPAPPNPYTSADPTELDRLTELLTTAGLPAAYPDAGGLFDLLHTTVLRYVIQPFPCPSVANLNTTPPSAGQPYTFKFKNATVPFYYTLTVIKVGTPDAIVFQKTTYFTAAPFEFAIPNKQAGTMNDTFVANAEYLFILHPTLVIGNKEVACGCVQPLPHTTSATTLTQIVYAALNLWTAKKC